MSGETQLPKTIIQPLTIESHELSLNSLDSLFTELPNHILQKDSGHRPRFPLVGNTETGNNAATPFNEVVAKADNPFADSGRPAVQMSAFKRAPKHCYRLTLIPEQSFAPKPNVSLPKRLELNRSNSRKIDDSDRRNRSWLALSYWATHTLVLTILVAVAEAAIECPLGFLETSRPLALDIWNHIAVLPREYTRYPVVNARHSRAHGTSTSLRLAGSLAIWH